MARLLVVLWFLASFAVAGTVGSSGTPAALGASDGVIGAPAVPAAPVAPGDSAPAAEPELYDDTIVRNISITVGSSDWQTLLGCRAGRSGVPGSTPTPRVDVPAVVEIDGVRLTDVGVRCKGNSSLNINSSKKPLNVNMDAFVPGQELWGFDIVNLNNGWNDPSQLREPIALRMFAEYLPSTRFGFARVTIQGTYVGLYAMVEQINGEFAEHWYPADNGTIIKGDSPVQIAFNSSTLDYLGESLSAYKSKYEVKGAAAAGDAGYEALREFTRALDAPTSSGGLGDAEFPDGIRQVLDVETALWYVATSNVIANFDSYYVGKNYYLYLGQRDPRFHVVPWDLGLSFGLFGLQNNPGGRVPGGGAVDSVRVSPFVQETDANRPLIRRLLAVPAYRADYVAHYRAFVAEVFTPEWVEEIGAAYQDVIREAVRDEAETSGRVAGAFTFAQFESNLRTPITTGGARPGMGGTAPGIVALVRDRRAYLDSLAALDAPDVALSTHACTPAAPTYADAVAVDATFAGREPIADVQLRYRVDGGFENIVPMTRGATGTWTGEIPAQRQGRTVSYVFRVGLVDGRASFFPTATLTRPFAYRVAGVQLPHAQGGYLLINEVQTDNNATLADEAGEYDDWVELYNSGTEAIDLGDYFLSDDPDDPWAFPLPTVNLDPGAFFLVWCDNDPEQGTRHAPFRLAKQGETVHLSTSEAEFDSVDIVPLGTDESLMRVPDGADDWLICKRATPDQANACAPDAATTPGRPTTTPTPVPPTATPLPGTEGAALVVNEVQTDNAATVRDEAGEYDDWVELYNRGDAAIGLGDYFLSDEAEDPWKFALPAMDLAPGARLLVWCDDTAEQGALHASFKLSKEGETVYLSTRAATIDAVPLAPMGTDESVMRVPDGATAWLVCGRATPNQANACAPSAVRTPGGPTVTPSTTPATTTPATTTPTPPGGSATPTAPTPGPSGRIWLPFAQRP